MRSARWHALSEWIVFMKMFLSDFQSISSKHLKQPPVSMTPYKFISPFSMIIKQIPTYAMHEKQNERNQNWVASQEALF